MRELTEDDIDKAFEKFPELELMEDDEIMFETIRGISMAPDYFWKVPSTESNTYHNPYSRSEHGLWIHTKMVFTVFERLSESWIEMGLLEEKHRDLGRSACLLHDIVKKGIPQNYTKGESSKKDHDILGGELVKNYTNLPECVSTAVCEHMGPWYEGEEPETKLGHIVHICDMVSSSKNINVGIYKPHDDITKKYPGIPRAYF